MGILATITAAFEATKAFFGWKTKVEENKPGQQKRDEQQEIRRTRDEEIEYNRQAVLRGVDPIAGELRPPAKDK